MTTHNRTPIPTVASPAAPAPPPAARRATFTPGFVPLEGRVAQQVAVAETNTERTRREESTAPPPAVTPIEHTISIKNMNSLMSQVSDVESPFFIANPLNDYLNYTYKFKLFMTSDQEFLTTLYEGDQQGEMPVSKVFEALDNTPQVVIAQSGVTAGFNIRDVRMESIVAPNMETTNTGATEFVINIHEPLGTSLVEVMRNAAISLQIRNLDKTFYFLELTFDGYLHNSETSDMPLPDGTGVDQIDDGITPRQNIPHQQISDKDYDNNGRWLYQIAITNIETELDDSGSRYTLTARPFNEGALDHTTGGLPSGMTVSGATIDDFLTSLKNQLNAAWRERMLQEVYTFDFKVHEFGDTNEDPGKFNLTVLVPEESSQRSGDWSTTNGLPTYHGRMGNSIAGIIESAFSSTRECQDRAHAAWLRSEEARAATPAERDAKKASTAAAALFIESRLFRVETDIEIKGYDYIDQIYRKHITFHIWPYYSQMPLISRTLADNAVSPEVQSRMLGELHDRGFFRKRYDYIYTGLNTDVIRLDIRFNLAWSAVLPLLVRTSATTHEQEAATARQGEEENPVNAGTYHTAEEIRALQQNPTTSYQATRVQLDRYNEETDRLREQLRALTQEQRDAGEEQRLTDEIAARGNSEERGKLLEARNITRGPAQARAAASEEQDRLAQAEYRTGAESTFLEDLEISPEDQTLPHIISFHTPYNEAYNAAGTGYLNGADGNRGVYGAILEQSYGPLTTGLINIDMEIRGDPYWLAHSNVERRLHMRSGPPPFSPLATMANYMEGDCVFLLNFSYPFTIDDDTGALVMRENEYGNRMDKFTGLYRVVRVTNVFDGGDFRQTLKAQRFPILDFARALGFTGTHTEDTLRSVDASPDAPAGQGAPAAGAGAAPVRDGVHTDDSRGVDPRLVRVYERARREGGVDFDIIDGVRSRAEAEQNARNGTGIRNSHHLRGDAVDVIPRIDGRRTYALDRPAAERAAIYANINNAMQAAARAEGVQITWGGTWRGDDYDPGHFELKPGYR